MLRYFFLVGLVFGFNLTVEAALHFASGYTNQINPAHAWSSLTGERVVIESAHQNANVYWCDGEARWNLILAAGGHWGEPELWSAEGQSGQVGLDQIDIPGTNTIFHFSPPLELSWQLDLTNALYTDLKVSGGIILVQTTTLVQNPDRPDAPGWYAGVFVQGLITPQSSEILSVPEAPTLTGLIVILALVRNTRRGGCFLN